MTLSKIRLINLALCVLGAAIVAAFAGSISWANGVFAVWTALPVLIAFPVAIVSAKMPQQLACLLVTTISFLFGIVSVSALSHSTDAFTPFVAWAMPAWHIGGAIIVLIVATVVATFLQVRVAKV